jgi:hypothetical protein
MMTTTNTTIMVIMAMTRTPSSPSSPGMNKLNGISCQGKLRAQVLGPVKHATGRHYLVVHSLQICSPTIFNWLWSIIVPEAFFNLDLLFLPTGYNKSNRANHYIEILISLTGSSLTTVHTSIFPRYSRAYCLYYMSRQCHCLG